MVGPQAVRQFVPPAFATASISQPKAMQAGGAKPGRRVGMGPADLL